MSEQFTNKKIFITGATGYVGQNLVNSLTKKGYTLYVLTRNETSIFSNNKDINIIIGDITDSIPLLPDIDTIYHCAGTINNLEEIERVNVLGTKNIVDIAIKNKCKLIYLSSAGVTGKTKNNILDENTICNPQNKYEVSKYKAEKIVTDAIKNGLNAIILRPTTIFGFKKNIKNDSFFQLMEAMRNGSYLNIGQGIYNIVHIDEVVKAMELLDETDTKSGTYIINNTITYKDVNMLVKNTPPIMNKKTITIAYPLAFISTIFLTFIYFLINKKSPLTFSRLKALTNKKIYSQNKILETSSFKNTLTIEEYIKKVCKEYIDSGLLS